MGRYFLRRLLGVIPVLFGLGTIVFFILHLLPGDPVATMLGFNYNPTTAENLRHALGLDKPLWLQYIHFWGRVLTGDLGRSTTRGVPVAEMLVQHFPATLQLAVAGILAAGIVGNVFGAFAAVKFRTWFDSGTMIIAILGVSLPGFWLGLLLILVFAVHLHWVPVVGQGGLSRLILPALAVALPEAAVIARLARSSMLEVLRSDYIRTAQAKGLRQAVVLWRHAARNAMIPVITVMGMQFGYMLGGTVIIENVFARQGIGRLTVQAILDRDIPVVQGCVLLLGVTYVLVNLMVDLSYSLVDPRIRLGVGSER